MSWEAWHSDLGWADPTTPSAHGDSALFVPLFDFFFFLTFPSPPFQTVSLRTSVKASPTQIHPCSRTHNYSLKQAMTSFQMIFLKWAGPRKFSRFPLNGGTSLWKIPRPRALVSRGARGERGARVKLGWCLNLWAISGCLLSVRVSLWEVKFLTWNSYYDNRLNYREKGKVYVFIT